MRASDAALEMKLDVENFYYLSFTTRRGPRIGIYIHIFIYFIFFVGVVSAASAHTRVFYS